MSSYPRKTHGNEAPVCVVCSTSFFFRDPIRPSGLKCPHILQCGHSTCEGCLISGLKINNTLMCPVCSTVSETKKFDAKNLKREELFSLQEEFPLDVYAVGQVSMKRYKPNIGEHLIKFCPQNKKMTKSNAAICNECNNRAAECSCRQCSTELCNGCFTDIHNSVTLRKHEKMTLKEKQAFELFEESMCQVHKGLFLNIFCKDCSIYICKECVVEAKHLEHHCVDTFQSNEEKLPEYLQLFDEANEVLKYLHATKKKLQQPGSKRGVINEDAEKVKRQVQVHFSYLHGMLQRQEEEMLKEIRSCGEMSKASLESLSVDLEKNIKDVENMLSVSNNLLATSKVNEIPLDCLLEKLRNVTGTPCHLVLNEGGETSKFEFRTSGNIAEVLANHCSVTVPTQQVFQLCSKDELPPTYVPESLNDEPDAFVKPDLDLIKTNEKTNVVQKKLLGAINSPIRLTAPPQKSAKAKPYSHQNNNFGGYNKTSRYNNGYNGGYNNNCGYSNNSVRRHNNKLSDSTFSLESRESTVDRLMNVETLDQGVCELVRMSHLCSPNNFYVQRLCNINDLETMRGYFSKNSNRSRAPPLTIENGRIYLVYFSKDNCWYRGRVVRSYDDLCDVYYVDYGNTDLHLSKSVLREIPEKYAVIPDLAIHCGLHGCTPIEGQWTPQAMELVTNIVNSNDLSMYVVSINQGTGFHEVYIRVNDISLTDALIFNEFATVMEAATKQEYFKSALGARKNAFKATEVKEKEVFDCIVTQINTPTNFYIQKVVNAGVLITSLMEEMTNTYNSYKPKKGIIYTPHVGMPVAARFENDSSWYRAVVIDIQAPRKVQVKYVDFGNISTISIDDIRELEDQFLRVAAQALSCSLSDIAPRHPRGWSASSKAAFEELALHNGLLRASVEKVKDNNALHVVLYQPLPTKYINISGTLVKRGHANSTGQTSAQAEYANRPDLEVRHLNSEPTQSDSESAYSEFSGVSKTSGARKKNLRAAKDSPSAQYKAQQQAQVQNVGSKVAETSQDIDSRVKVELLKVISPSEIYVACGNAQKQIEKLVKEMTLVYASKQFVEEREWAVGDLCAVMKKSDSKWYRGVITEASHNCYKVYIKDKVEVEDTDKSMLRSLEQKFCSVADGSIKVHLGGLKVPAGLKTWPSGTTDYVRQLMKETEALYIEKLDEFVLDSIPVRLWKKTQKFGGPLEPLIDQWCDVNESLINLGLALRDRGTKEIMPSPSVETDDSYVKNWLTNSFQGAAEAPYFSDLVATDSMSVKSVKTPRYTPRSRASRGRFPSQRPEYVPSIIGPEQSEVITEWIPAAPLKKLNFVCRPTYVDNHCNIYIQDFDSVDSTLELIENALLSLYDNSVKRPYEEEYMEGQICIAFYELTQKWYRGRVTKVNAEDIEVLFVDYGNVENLQADQLRKQVSMGHIPIQCHRCTTEGIIPISPDGKWPTPALDFVHISIVEKKCMVNLREKDNGDYIIMELKLPGGEDLWEALLSLHYATYPIDCEAIVAEEEEYIKEDLEVQQVFTKTTDSPVLASEIFTQNSTITNMSANAENNDLSIEDHVKSLREFMKTSSWCNEVENEPHEPRLLLRYREMILPDSLVEFPVTVLCVVNCTSVKIMITECDDPEVMEIIANFNQMDSDILEEVDNLPLVSEPIKDLACLGCFTEDDTWYRAIIKSVSPDKEFVTVYYVDYGNSEDLPITRLKEIKPEWVDVPVQAFQVRLHNIREGPNFEMGLCKSGLSSCFSDSPYTVTIETRFPSMQVELYNKHGELAYKPLLEAGILTVD